MRLSRTTITTRDRVRRHLKENDREEITIPQLGKALAEDGGPVVLDPSLLGSALRSLGWYRERDLRNEGQGRMWVKPLLPIRRSKDHKPELVDPDQRDRAIFNEAWDRWYGAPASPEDW